MQSNELRSRAEEAVMLTRRDISKLPIGSVQQLVHELQVHQIELEMQNESLQQIQDALEESHHDYRGLYEGAPVGYVTVDASGSIVLANAAALRLLRGSRSVLGKPLVTFVSPPDADRLRQHMGNAQRHAHSSCEVSFIAHGERDLDVQLEIRPAPSRKGQCLVIMTDISARKRAQSALADANQRLELQVAARSIQLEARNRQLEAEIVRRGRSEQQRQELETRVRDAERLDSIRRVAGGIAHEFNNLLVSVLGYAELLLRAPDVVQDGRELLTLIKSAARTAADLTRQLLVYAGHGQVELLPVDFAEVVADSLELLRTRLLPGMQLRTEITAHLPPIEADRGQIHQLVTNLVTNAIEAVDGSGMIVIRMRCETLDPAALARFQRCKDALPGQFAILQLLDTGRGIEPNAVSRIFDPFFTTKFTGRGMGLASVLGIVQGHRGAMRVSSKLGEGTMFEVAIPLSPLGRDIERLPVIEDASWQGSGSVLLIDDDDDVRGVIAKMLARLGFEVIATASGDEGLERFRDAHPRFAFVVLDWMMPVMSGENVLKALRELEPCMPIILTSGYGTENLATQDEYVARLQKPMTLAQLQDAIRGICGPQGAHARLRH